MDKLNSNKMTQTNHSNTRMRQRGISEEMLSQAIQFGTVIQKQGIDMIVIRDKDIPVEMNKQKASKLKRLVVYMSGDVVITVFKRSKGALKYIKKKGKINKKKTNQKIAA